MKLDDERIAEIASRYFPLDKHSPLKDVDQKLACIHAIRAALTEAQTNAAQQSGKESTSPPLQKGSASGVAAAAPRAPVAWGVVFPGEEKLLSAHLSEQAAISARPSFDYDTVPLYSASADTVAEPREPVAIKFLCYLYWSAYHAGHHDTVEASYTDVLSVDSFDYWKDKVLECIESEPTLYADHADTVQVPTEKMVEAGAKCLAISPCNDRQGLHFSAWMGAARSVITAALAASGEKS